MRKINAINTKKQRLWSQLEQIYFRLNLKIRTKQIERCMSIFEKGKIIFSRCHCMSGLDPEFRITRMEIKVAEINAPLNQQRRN